jgi:hypothetical protein
MASHINRDTSGHSAPVDDDDSPSIVSRLFLARHQSDTPSDATCHDVKPDDFGSARPLAGEHGRHPSPVRLNEIARRGRCTTVPTGIASSCSVDK